MSEPILSIVIPGRPITKKNHQQIVVNPKTGRPFLVQSPKWKEYERFCIGGKRRPGWLMQWGNMQIDQPIHVEAHYFLPNRRGWPDLQGLIQGTADLLEKSGIISNDKLIRSWDFSRLHETINEANPRVEIIVRPFNPGE